MRKWGAAIFLIVAACQQQPAKPAAGADQIAFEGAQVSDAAAIRAHGERLTHVLGCTGCHGIHLEGTFFTEHEPQYGPLYASNLSVELPGLSDAQIEDVLRKGVHPERKTVWGMPSEIFQHLSAADMTALIAYLRSIKPVGKKLPPPQFSAQDKKDIAAGQYKPAVTGVRETKDVFPVDAGAQHALGRYIASVTCAECHSPKLEGKPGDPVGKIPDLIVAGGYSRAEFETLITTGVPVGGRKLNPMMSGVAKTRFSHLTPHERDALYAYLKARAEMPKR
ncbi:MAG: c-type cytochrome [Sphingomicrobium sp.]